MSRPYTPAEIEQHLSEIPGVPLRTGVHKLLTMYKEACRRLEGWTPPPMIPTKQLPPGDYYIRAAD